MLPKHWDPWSSGPQNTLQAEWLRLPPRCRRGSKTAMAPTSPTKELSSLESTIIGGITGSIAEAVVMPALVIKTRMMAQGADASLVSYRSAAHAATTMLRDEGFGAFYKGLGLSVVFTPLARGLYMTGIEMSHSTFGQGTSLTDFAAGMSAQLVSSIAYVPRDIVVERCAIDGQIAKQVGSTASSVAALKTIFSTEGAMGFFRAFVPHQLVWVPFNGIFMWALGRCKQFEVDNGVEQTYMIGVGNTFCAAAFAAACTNPIDVIKTRMQIAGANTEVFAYSGPADCLKQLLRSEGPRALFAGIGGRFLYTGPAFAIFFPTYDLLKTAYVAL
jgi:hypothetical protein